MTDNDLDWRPTPQEMRARLARAYANNECATCGENCSSYTKFCMSCGAENTSFSADDYAAEYGRSHTNDLANDCNPEGHARIAQRLQADTPGRTDQPYCDVCGDRLW